MLTSHVCRDWRSTALQLPSLWSNIITSEPELADLFLTRALSAPLYVLISGYSIEKFKILAHLLAQRIGQIRVLMLYGMRRRGYGRGLHTVFSPLIPPHYWPLHVLEVTCDNYVGLGRLPDVLKLGDDLFFNEQGDLRIPLEVFKFEGLFHLSWDPRIFRNLRSFKWRYGKRNFLDHFIAPSYSQFLQVLQQCQHLEVLSLDGVGPSYETQLQSHFSDLVEVPRLRKLKLKFDQAENISAFISALSLPQCANVGFNHEIRTMAARSQVFSHLDLFPTDRYDLFKTLLLELVTLVEVELGEIRGISAKSMPEEGSSVISFIDEHMIHSHSYINLPPFVLRIPSTCSSSHKVHPFGFRRSYLSCPRWR
ncbi:hypothetical protein C8Q75DRAFT_237141 [Abortiporus biennis]|nr:hypothetical protein C8Q75DRAFT_237141 [Abortiporus biennis]